MHSIQQKLLALSKHQNLAQMSLREMAAAISLSGETPQKIKHHLEQLEKKGFLAIDRSAGVMTRASALANISEGLMDVSTPVFSIPILGTANCGPATIYSEENFEGFLRVSSKLVGRTRPSGLFAVRADGNSMNKANLNGKGIEDGDFIIIDSLDKNVTSNDIVLTIVDGKATVKRLIHDIENEQVVLMADSSFDYDPIYLHTSDDFQVNGKVISILKKPKM